MATRREVLKAAAVASVATAILGAKSVMATTAGLTWKHFPAGENGFFRAPVLISGAHEAVLIDAAIQRAAGNLSAAARLLGITRAQIGYRLKRRGEAE